MAQSRPLGSNVGFRLRAEFESEATRLVGAERGRTPTEGILRLRALADIAEQLSAEGLVELAAAVAAVKSEGGLSLGASANSVPLRGRSLQ